MRFHRIFLNEIKAKGYKVIGFNVFLISLLADPGEGPAPSPPKRRPNGGPKGRKKFLGDRAPSSEGLDSPLLLNEIPVSQKAYLVPPILLLFTLSPSRERIKYPEYRHMILEQQNMQGNEVYQECDQQGKRVTGWPFTRDIEAHKRYQLSTESKPRRGKLASKAKQKFNGDAPCRRVNS